MKGGVLPDAKGLHALLGCRTTSLPHMTIIFEAYTMPLHPS
jgi:hypothetical protein